MKICLQPGIYTSPKNIQTHKNNSSKNLHKNDSVSFASQPAFTGSLTGNNKLIPFLMAASASLIILAGCGQTKQQTNINSGTRYVPPSYQEIISNKDEAHTSVDSNPDASDDGKEISEACKTPACAVYPSSTPKSPSESAAADTTTEKSIKEQKLYVKSEQLKSLEENLADVNAQLSDVQRKYDAAKANLETAEEKLGTYKRKDPNDKPPGFEADYNIYINIYNAVKELEGELAALKEDKADLEARQAEILADVSSLGGHPHLN